MNDFRIIRPAELAKRLSVCKKTLDRMEARGELPKRLKISRNVVGWRSDQLEEWLESRQTAEA